MKDVKHETPSNGNGHTTTGLAPTISDVEKLQTGFRPANGNDSRLRRRRVEILLSVQEGLREHGSRRGIDSGDVEPNSSTEETLRAFARAAGEDAFRENFDPENSIHDKSRQEAYDSDRVALRDANLALLNERSKQKDAESLALKAQANLPAEPAFPAAIVVVAVPLITLTVAFALYDTFVSALGFILALTFALLAGLCWGAFVCSLILHRYSSQEEGRDWMSWVGLIAGIGMAVALGFVRFSQSSREFYWLIFGLTLLEVFIVLGLEFFARRYRQALADRLRKFGEANDAQSKADSIKSEIDRRRERVNELEDKVDDHVAYLDERELRAKQRDQMVAAAETAVIEGYRGAVAKNKGDQLR